MSRSESASAHRRLFAASGHCDSTSNGNMSTTAELQSDGLCQKDRELQQLRKQLESQRRELESKTSEIRGLRLQRASPSLSTNPNRRENVRFNGDRAQQRWSFQWNTIFQCGILFMLVLHSLQLSDLAPPHRQDTSEQPTTEKKKLSELAPLHRQGSSEQLTTEKKTSRTQVRGAVKGSTKTGKLKPWESVPPEPIPFMENKDGPIQQRHTCIQRIRAKQFQIFQEIFDLQKNPNPDILLVDPAYHANVGDHMLTLGELELIQKSLNLKAPAQCHYVQAGHYYPVCTDLIYASDTRAKTKVALWHAGGNWGDLWPAAQDVRIPSIRTLLLNGYKVIGLPQSLHYGNKQKEREEVGRIKDMVTHGLASELNLDLDDNYNHEDVVLRRRLDENSVYWQDPDGNWNGDTESPEDQNNYAKSSIIPLDTEEGMAIAHSKAIFTWREKESYEKALELYPFVKNLLVPDMAFQLGPYSPIRNNADELVDILLLLRDDLESKVKSQRNAHEIRKILPKSKTTFTIVDWPDRLRIFNTEDFFFTDKAIELLSLGKVVVCDRLHAAILAYLSGIPFVFIDQVSRKITRTLTAAFDGMDDCLDGRKALWARAQSLEEALKIATKMIDRNGL